MAITRSATNSISVKAERWDEDSFGTGHSLQSPGCAIRRLCGVALTVAKAVPQKMA
jgi:hypothetical protein